MFAHSRDNRTLEGFDVKVGNGGNKRFSDSEDETTSGFFAWLERQNVVETSLSFDFEKGFAGVWEGPRESSSKLSRHGVRR
jgi:hypothetical protein